MTRASSSWLSISDTDLEGNTIAVIIPAYNVEREIEGVITSLPTFLRHVIVVDDASTDRTAQVVACLAKHDARVIPLRHDVNQGVGGAMVTGFREALHLNAKIIVKMDGDGQMPVAELPRLLAPLLRKEADYTKGNRFGDFRALARMPYLRRAGNVALSFLAKAATGYWNCFDPTNGFLAIRREVLHELRLEEIDRTYFFEHSMLAQLYLTGAVVHEVFMPARYGDEPSHLSLRRVLWQFPPRLMRCFLRRMLLKNFVYDFTMESVYLLIGLPMLLGGILYGSYHWYLSSSTGIPAHTGTVVIPAMLIILGMQFLLTATSMDVQQVPVEPRCRAVGDEIGTIQVVSPTDHTS
jgi:dolichol-phosphate mannosyltransferase